MQSSNSPASMTPTCMRFFPLQLEKNHSAGSKATRCVVHPSLLIFGFQIQNSVVCRWPSGSVTQWCARGRKKDILPPMTTSTWGETRPTIEGGTKSVKFILGMGLGDVPKTYFLHNHGYWICRLCDNGKTFFRDAGGGRGAVVWLGKLW